MKSLRTRFRQRAPIGVGVLTVCFLLCSCGQRSTHVEGDLVGGAHETIAPSPSPPLFDVVAPNYDAPISDGETVTDMDSARALLSFDPLVPKGLGEPSRILVSRPDDVAQDDRALGLVYDTASYGRVTVVEDLQHVSPQEYDSENKALLAENGNPNTHGSVEIIDVRDGQQALITTSEEGNLSQIFWLERDNLEISILGPSLNSEDCQKLANTI
jgi:hypothetical protein